MSFLLQVVNIHPLLATHPWLARYDQFYWYLKNITEFNTSSTKRTPPHQPPTVGKFNSLISIKTPNLPSVYKKNNKI